MELTSDGKCATCKTPLAESRGVYYCPNCLLASSSIWVCPVCSHEQQANLQWCGKNLQCQNCQEYSYYKEWIIK